MKTRSELLLISYLFLITEGILSCERETSKVWQISKVASAVLKIDGFPDFLAVDGKDVWITNEGKVEKLSLNNSIPILSVAIPAPCGAMIAGFGALWVANCSDRSVYRIDKTSGRVMKNISTGLANKYGELSLAVGAGSVWVMSDSSGILTRIN